MATPPRSSTTTATAPTALFRLPLEARVAADAAGAGVGSTTVSADSVARWLCPPDPGETFELAFPLPVLSPSLPPAAGGAGAVPAAASLMAWQLLLRLLLLLLCVRLLASPPPPPPPRTRSEDAELDRRWFEGEEREPGAKVKVARLRKTAVGAAARSLHHTFLVREAGVTGAGIGRLRLWV